MPQPLLEGRVEPDAFEALQDKVERLEGDLETAQNRLRAAKEHSVLMERALGELRRQLGPLFKAMRMVFGELDAAGIEDGGGAADAGPHMNSRVISAWETWKRKLGGKQADFIQAFLDHGAMTAVQLKVATHSGSSTVSETLGKLRSLTLVEKNQNGTFSLKELP